MKTSLLKASALIFSLLMLYGTAVAQTTLINPAGDGGFETGADFAANGWTVANGTVTNKWFVGTVPSGFTNKAAYVSNDATGATWAYTNTSTSVVHFWRDVTFPAGQSDITLSFNWAANGETSSFDALMVSLAPTTYTPTASSTSLGTSALASPAVTLTQLWATTTAQTATIKIPASLINNCSSASTWRLIFTWKNDASGGVAPPAAIDNISLVSQNFAASPGRITSTGGTFSINSNLANTGANFTTFTEAVNSLNNASTFCAPLIGSVIFNVEANQTFNEIVPPITASGTATSPITFQKSGSGANPVILRTDAGILTTSSMGGQGDAVVTIDGADYLSFDKIDVSASDQGVEYGYLLRKASGTDGCKDVIIKNANVTMTKGTSTYVTGIYSSNLVSSSAVNSATGVTVSSVGGRNENVTITGNTISNVFYGIQLRGFAAATPYDFYDQNIQVGVDSGNNITGYGGGATTTYGVYAIYQNALKIAKNLIVSATGTTTTLYGIFTSTGVNSNVDIYNNTVTIQGGGTTSSIYAINNAMGGTGTNNQVNIYNNTVTNSTYATATTGDFFAIYQSATAFKSHIYGNTVSNNTVSPTTTGLFHGIYQGGAVVNEGKIYNNIITNNTKTSGTTSGSMYCIWNSPAATANTDIYSNVIVNNTHTGTTSGILYGINQTTGATTNIYKNTISGLATNSTGGSVYGISITGGTTNNVYNNFISDLNAATTSATADAIRGISVSYTTATTNINLSFNTIFLNASSSGANFSSSGIFHTTSATATTASLSLRSNNVVNLSTPNGTGKASVYRRSSTALGNYNSNSNNNNFYAGSPSSNNVIFYDGTNFDQDISSYKLRVTPIDNNSIYENPPFINSSSLPYDLHINSTLPTQLESGGVAVTGITDDYDGNLRSATPDIGADEFAGIGADLTGPNITYSALAASCTAGDRVVSGVTITDASGVPVTGNLVPRIYFRKGNGAWFSNPGTLTSGTATNGVWSFTIAAAPLGGVVFGDVISYYIIAQDVAPTPNISSNPSGVVASNVNTVTVHPTAPNTYIVGAQLSGSYNVGSNNVIKTLTSAAALYNGCPVSGAVIFNLTDASYTENFPVVIGANSAASATNTLTIQPAIGVAVNISGTSGAVGPSSIVRLDGAKYVRIDGINTSSSSLAIENTSTVAGSAVIWLSSAGVGQGSSNNIIKGVDIKAGVTQNTATTTTYGIVIAGNTLSGTITAITPGNDNDNNTIDGCTFSRVRYGIYTAGGSAANPNLGTVIQKNIIGPSFFGTEEIGKGGIVVREEDGIQIIQNEIRFVGGDFSNTTGGSDRVGIALETDAAWTATTALIKNATVSKNLIHDVVDERTFSAVGIALAAADGSNATNNIIANNMIYGLLSNGTASDQTVGIGITAGKGDKIVFNSIYLTGDTDPGASTTPTQSNYGIRISSTSATDLSVLNNAVFMDLSSGSAAATVKNACIDIPASYTWGNGGLNFNDWYIISGNPRSNIGSIGNTTGTFYNTLPDWQTATGRDANSLSADPMFFSSSNLHLQNGSTLDDKGTPVTGVSTDIDGEARDASTPDIGADEVPLSNGLDVKASQLISPAATNGCYNNETVIIRIKNNSTSALNFAANPATVTVNVTGAATATLSAIVNTGTLASGASQDVILSGTLNMSATGTYTFNATATVAGDVNTANNAMPVATRTKDVLSAGTITSNQAASYCLSGTPTLTASNVTGTSGIQWQQSTVSGSGFTNISGGTLSPFTLLSSITQTMYYRLVATCGTNSVTSTEIMITVNNPQVASVAPANRCGPGTVTLDATGSAGTTLNWYAAATGGTSLYTGSSFTTPSISANTTYYVSASTGTSITPVGGAGVAWNTVTTTGAFQTTTGAGQLFTVIQPLTIASMDIYPSAAMGTSFTIEVRSGSTTGAIVATYTATTTVQNSGTPSIAQTVPVNFNITSAGTYYVGFATTNPNTWRSDFLSSTSPYPVTLPGYLSITGASVTGYWYYLYNWQISTACESPRTPVLARTDICTVYTFMGNGNFNDPANWVNGMVPPSNVAAGTELIINPSGVCVLNVPLTVNAGAIITVKTGKHFIIQGNLILQ